MNDSCIHESGGGGVAHIFVSLFSDLRLQGSLVGESVTGVFLLQNEGDNMYKEYHIYSCLVLLWASYNHLVHNKYHSIQCISGGQVRYHITTKFRTNEQLVEQSTGAWGLPARFHAWWIWMVSITYSTSRWLWCPIFSSGWPNASWHSSPRTSTWHRSKDSKSSSGIGEAWNVEGISPAPDRYAVAVGQ